MLALAAALNASKPDGVREIYPGFGSVYVEWDDARLSNERAKAWVDAALDAPDQALDDARQSPSRWPTAASTRTRSRRRPAWSAEEIARCHAEPEYQVSAAASVGQPMMTGVDERLHVPRRKTPRTDVPALAVAIANEQTTIYPAKMPGGWNAHRHRAGQRLRPAPRRPVRVPASATGCGSSRATASRPRRPSADCSCPPEPQLPAFRVEERGTRSTCCSTAAA